jgi:glycosyltransferase involved in cell wall biosynthesis
VTGLRIGINALYLIPGEVGGTEIHLRSLLSALAAIGSAHHYTVFTNREADGELVPERGNFRRVVLPVRARRRPARLLVEQILLPAAAARARLDVLLNPGFTAPAFAPCPTVTVFHDLQHKRHPEHFRRLDLPAWRLLLFQSAHRSTRLVAVSEATRQDLLRFYAIPTSRIDVIPHGVDPRLFAIGRQRRREGTAPLLLCVSTLHPHKNLERLIRAYHRLRQSRPELRLVLAGLRGLRAREIERLIARLGLSDAVRVTGWVPREELYELFLRAHAFVYPSTFEGFGMPVLEALAAGIPSACSAIDPIRTIAGGAALLFDPLDDAAMLAALVRITSEGGLRERLARDGPLRAAQFSWEAAAEATLDSLQRAARPARGSEAPVPRRDGQAA